MKATRDSWVCSDTHFCHAKMAMLWRTCPGWEVLGYVPDDPKERQRIIDEHDEWLIDTMNAVVKPQDRLYIVGDVVFGKANIAKIMPRLNGKIKLIQGNHDIYGVRPYLPYVEEVYGMYNMSKYGVRFSFTHAPFKNRTFRWNEDMQQFGINVNIHGHEHRRHNERQYMGNGLEVGPTNMMTGKSSYHWNANVDVAGPTPVHLETIADTYKYMEKEIMV